MYSKRRSNRLHLSSHANVRSTRSRHAWIAVLNSLLRPRFVALRLRGFSLMFGIIPALKIALRFALESHPPSRLRYAPSSTKPVSLAPRLSALRPSGSSTVSALLTGATGRGGQHIPVVFD